MGWNRNGQICCNLHQEEIIYCVLVSFFYSSLSVYCPHFPIFLLPSPFPFPFSPTHPFIAPFSPLCRLLFSHLSLSLSSSFLHPNLIIYYHLSRSFVTSSVYLSIALLSPTLPQTIHPNILLTHFVITQVAEIKYKWRQTCVSGNPRHWNLFFLISWWCWKSARP